MAGGEVVLSSESLACMTIQLERLLDYFLKGCFFAVLSLIVFMVMVVILKKRN